MEKHTETKYETLGRRLQRSLRRDAWVNRVLLLVAILGFLGAGLAVLL